MSEAAQNLAPIPATANPQTWLYRLATPAILLGAALIRFWALGRPSTLVFDETYYVKDAFTLWQLGFESRWPADIDAAFAAGDVHTFLPEAAFVVHPPVGKWLISLGLMLGGAENPWAWRLSSAVVGVLAVWLVIRIAQRLFRSPVLGWLAGILMAVDGLAIVHSRTALLDQFLMFFVLAAFGVLLIDRDQFAAQPPNFMPYDIVPKNPKRFRSWRLAAGVLLGLACGVKWSGAYFVAGFGVLTVFWDLLIYREGARRQDIPFKQVAVRWLCSALQAFVSLVPVAALTYLASWFSWFITPGAWGRDWAANHPESGIQWLPPLLRSWVQYHSQVWTFHTGLDTPHPYSAQAYKWLLQLRPTAFYWGTKPELAIYPGCARLSQCAMAVNSLGNPILWWLATVAIVITIWWGIKQRDWRATAALSGIAFGWAPWLLYPERTTFAFYAIAFLPWMILALCYVFSIIKRYPAGREIIATTMVIILIVSTFFYPIWTAMPIQRGYWQMLMWLPGWI